MNTRSKLGMIFLALAVVGVAFFVGVYAGYHERPEVNKITSLLNKEEPLVAASGADFDAFWKVWNVLNEKYIAATSTIPSDQEKVWGAIAGLASSYGDPYTVFFPPKEATIFQSDVNGNFGGVGMEIGIRNGVLAVISPLKNTPAEKAGLKAGDTILEINGVRSVDTPVDEAIQKIRGKQGTSVKLKIGREGISPFEVSITRDIINIPVIDTKLRSDGVFVISLYTFAATSPDAFRGALQEFTKSGSDKLILDLRGNPGGFLEAAVDIASWFLPQGKTVVRENFKDHDNEQVYRSKGYDIFTDKLKMAILINGGSASASEILAGALREHGKAVLVGEKSFGKGSVQELVPITSDTSLKVTIARWLTPNGVSISEEKLAPDYEVKMTAEDVKAGKDPQMEKAAGLLKAKK
ncbi:MAG: S41 family peptidase [Candidatus Lloydbacteria bacterium]|nr:S41 family peptidase [Candidatus Lloydbacteria bacterium]